MEPSQPGKLWDSVQPLEKALGELERALNHNHKPRSGIVRCNAAKTAPSDA